MIGLVVVSHSASLAAGVAELAGQMAPSVAIVACGGDGAGGLGTDYAAVVDALAAADSGDGVVVLFDLGSARMVAEMAAESVAGSVAGSAGVAASESAGVVLVVDAPLVEGAVAAAVRAQGGAPLAEVAKAAEAAFGPGAGSVPASPGDLPASPAAASAAPEGAPVVPGGASPASPASPAAAPGVAAVAAVVPRGASPEDTVRAEVRLLNEVGLHARPAALVVRALDPLDASVVVRFGSAEADAKSVLALMGLGAPGGAAVEVVARGADAAEAVRRVLELAERRFDE
ncbi:dihydroxyacetone kinase phosphoryl donor subunit DhaM [Saccharothrix sp. BKS2]|uniref:dihydroxyacetone kinase phosphoryl donor subunit DhaM n=1 Tax=Saccharothrix sp. BKS2 TaxID=3064400 RepID=UPI0039ECBFA4